MPTYISLLKLGHQGVTSIKESPSRLDAARELLRNFGVEMKDVYLTLLAVSASGNVTSETLRAFREDEYRDVVGAIQPAGEHPAFAAAEAVRQKLVESLEELQRALRRD